MGQIGRTGNLRAPSPARPPAAYSGSGLLLGLACGLSAAGAALFVALCWFFYQLFRTRPRGPPGPPFRTGRVHVPTRSARSAPHMRLRVLGRGVGVPFFFEGGA